MFIPKSNKFIFLSLEKENYSWYHIFISVSVLQKGPDGEGIWNIEFLPAEVLES